MKHLYARAHFTPPPAAPGLNSVCGLALSGAGMAFAGGPRCGPPAIPWRTARLASGRSCRRLPGGRMLVAVVLHLLCADKSAGSGGHVKFRSRWRKRGTLRNAAASGTVFCAGIGSPKIRRPLCPLPPSIIHDPEENCHPERDDAPEPVSWSGRAANGRSCGFFTRPKIASTDCPEHER